MASFNTIDDLDDAQRVLVRLDLNSPVEDGKVQDNRRFQRHAKTVKELAEAGHRVVLMAHQGRPGNDTFVSLDQHADILGGYIDREIQFVDDIYGEKALDAIDSLEAGEVLLLDNTRMSDDELPEEDPEVKAETEFVQTLAPHFDAYINDAYSAAHRKHASLVGFPLVLPAFAGRVMETEYEANTAIANREFDGQVTMVVGGTKATDVIGVMNTLGDKIDTFCMGGIASHLFLRAAGYDVGYDRHEDLDLYDTQWENNKEIIQELYEERRDQIKLPEGLAYEDDDDERAEHTNEELNAADYDYMDISEATVDKYDPIIRDSDAVFLKGALGVFEDEKFSAGTVGAIKAIAETDCFSVVGGGDTSRSIEMYGMDENDFDHVSIAGGAYIRALTGDDLPGIELLIDAAN
ncbi:phosphoglycerate kinase [Halonotius terrestris]|uniref:Phosphoglycerate kinase n=1 Tax=Halonotius terrestris TaxID=2487750 RepID=A0A8J8P950_9EURY|nr:phosphoglycerate kinase [Halonotius terrestris]TQQ81319.1 phosphoglycerate kinase [Halonotius terrestris]